MATPRDSLAASALPSRRTGQLRPKRLSSCATAVHPRTTRWVGRRRPRSPSPPWKASNAARPSTRLVRRLNGKKDLTDAADSESPGAPHNPPGTPRTPPRAPPGPAAPRRGYRRGRRRHLGSELASCAARTAYPRRAIRYSLDEVRPRRAIKARSMARGRAMPRWGRAPRHPWGVGVAHGAEVEEARLEACAGEGARVFLHGLVGRVPHPRSSRCRAERSPPCRGSTAGRKRPHRARADLRVRREHQARFGSWREARQLARQYL